jgi:ABC-2 type transport system ATP-binding protein
MIGLAASPVAEVAIRCRGLSRFYGAIKAVEDLDLDVPYGSVFGFLGRNGAGKTTTIRMLAGLARPTRGTAWVAGIEATTADSRARRLFGYLPQNPAFYAWMTPVEYLDYCARLFELSPAETKARRAEMLALAGLEAAARRRIGGFSGGMIQRLGIAQAMLHDPRVLILDEPTSALDPAGRFEVLDMVHNLRGRVTVFLSSHILADIERVCDTVAIIRSGRLELVAGRDELLKRYTANLVILEVSPEDQPALKRFAEMIQDLPWVQSIEVDQTSLRISASDLSQARDKLLPLVVEQHLAIIHYEWVHPTLEEIFLKISA